MTHADSSEARNNAARATSSGVPSRRMGCHSVIACFCASGIICWLRSVRMVSGARQCEHDDANVEPKFLDHPARHAQRGHTQVGTQPMNRLAGSPLPRSEPTDVHGRPRAPLTGRHPGITFHGSTRQERKEPRVENKRSSCSVKSIGSPGSNVLCNRHRFLCSGSVYV